jgi:hypothetical protein
MPVNNYTSVSITLPFLFNNGGGTSSTYNYRQQYQDLVIATLMTRPGERVRRPTFGTRLSEVVLDSESDAIVVAKDAVTRGFNLFLPDLTLNYVDAKIVQIGSNDTALSVTIDYELPTKETDQVTLKVGAFNQSGDLIREIK